MMAFRLDTQNREEWPSTSDLFDLEGTVDGFDYGFKGELSENDYFRLARLPGVDIHRSEEENYSGNYEVSGVLEERYLDAVERRLEF